MEDREDGGFDVNDNRFQEKSMSDRTISEEVSYDTSNICVEPAIEFLERANIYLGGEVRDAQVEAESILRTYAVPEGFSDEFLEAERAVKLLEMEVEQAREVNSMSGELDDVIDELEEAYELVQVVYDECSERNILSYGYV